MASMEIDVDRRDRESGEEGERRTVRREGEPRRRRLRDRLEGEGAVRLSPVLRQPALVNPMLNCEDDLRQTARELEGLERFLLEATRVLEKGDLTREDLVQLLSEDVDARVDALADALSSLRKSLQRIGGELK